MGTSCLKRVVNDDFEPLHDPKTPRGHRRREQAGRASFTTTSKPSILKPTSTPLSGRRAERDEALDRSVRARLLRRRRAAVLTVRSVMRHATVSAPLLRRRLARALAVPSVTLPVIVSAPLPVLFASRR